MGHAYTPGLRVAARTVVRRKRILPIPGTVTVRVGDAVEAGTVVARTDLPGKVHTINVVNLLGIMPEELQHYMLKKEKESVQKDEPIAESKPLIKWFKTAVKSPIAGTVENISAITGQVLLREPPQPLELRAYIDGKIEEVIEGQGAIVETTAAFIQGIFGVGGETTGILAMAVKSPDEDLAPEKITNDHRDKIIIGGSHISGEALNRARECGVRGVVVGAIHDKDLRALLGYDLGVAITGTEKIGLTLIITEGFGTITMAKKTFDLLSSKAGKKASISGATQIRAGVMRPEIIVTDLETRTTTEGDAGGWERGAMKEGDSIRVIREPYFGKIGRVKALPNELVKIETESPARVLEAEFPDGKNAIIPRANVELIEE